MEFIDEHPVVSHRVRFQNRAEITEDQAVLVRDDMVVVWLLRARCLPPQYHPVAKEGEERYRFNIQDVEAAMPLAGEVRDEALVYIEHGTDQAYLSFGVPRFSQDGLFDPGKYGPSTAENLFAQLTALLEDRGELQADETPLEAVRRLLGDPPVSDDPTLPYHDSIPVSFENRIEVVDHVYGPAHRSETTRFLEEAFGPA